MWHATCGIFVGLRGKSRMQHDTALLAKQLMWPEKRDPLKNVNFHKTQQEKSRQKINIKKKNVSQGSARG